MKVRNIWRVIVLSSSIALMSMSVAHGADPVLKNDGWATGSLYACQNGFIGGEAAAAGLAAPATHYPIKLKSIQVLACGNATGTWGIEIYQDALDASPEPGPLVWPMSGATSFDITGPTEGAELRTMNVGAHDIVLRNSFRVAVRLPVTGAIVPLAADDDGTYTAARNTVHSSDTWVFATTFGLNRDFVIRAAYERLFCQGLKPNRVGTAAGETLTGASKADVMAGLRGNDTISGMGRGDKVCAGLGNDVVKGGDGADSLNGDAGNDQISGGAGNDVLRGGAGVDVLNGGPGRDTCIGGPGGDGTASCEIRKSV